jgi:hypothetical protein
MATLAASRGHRFVVLVPPMHPAVRDGIPKAFLTSFDELLQDVRQQTGADILDETNLLPDSAFRDCVHLLSASAPILTDRLAERLRGGPH